MHGRMTRRPTRRVWKSTRACFTERRAVRGVQSQAGRAANGKGAAPHRVPRQYFAEGLTVFQGKLYD